MARHLTRSTKGSDRSVQGTNTSLSIRWVAMTIIWSEGDLATAPGRLGGGELSLLVVGFVTFTTVYVDESGREFSRDDATDRTSRGRFPRRYQGRTRRRTRRRQSRACPESVIVLLPPDGTERTVATGEAGNYQQRVLFNGRR